MGVGDDNRMVIACSRPGTNLRESAGQHIRREPINKASEESVLIAELMVDARGDRVPLEEVDGPWMEEPKVAVSVVRATLVRRRNVVILNQLGRRIDPASRD